MRIIDVPVRIDNGRSVLEMVCKFDLDTSRLGVSKNLIKDGNYTITIIVDDKSYKQSFTVKDGEVVYGDSEVVEIKSAPVVDDFWKMLGYDS